MSFVARKRRASGSDRLRTANHVRLAPVLKALADVAADCGLEVLRDRLSILRQLTEAWRFGSGVCLLPTAANDSDFKVGANDRDTNGAWSDNLMQLANCSISASNATNLPITQTPIKQEILINNSSDSVNKLPPRASKRLAITIAIWNVSRGKKNARRRKCPGPTSSPASPSVSDIDTPENSSMPDAVKLTSGKENFAGLLALKQTCQRSPTKRDSSDKLPFVDSSDIRSGAAEKRPRGRPRKFAHVTTFGNNLDANVAAEGALELVSGAAKKRDVHRPVGRPRKITRVRRNHTVRLVSVAKRGAPVAEKVNSFKAQRLVFIVPTSADSCSTGADSQSVDYVKLNVPKQTTAISNQTATPAAEHEVTPVSSDNNIASVHGSQSNNTTTDSSLAPAIAATMDLTNASFWVALLKALNADELDWQTQEPVLVNCESEHGSVTSGTVTTDVPACSGLTQLQFFRASSYKSDDGYIMHRCNECCRESRRLNELLSHMGSHFKQRIGIDVLVASWSLDINELPTFRVLRVNPDSQSKKCKQKLYVCQHCGKTFVNNFYYVDHVRTHSTERTLHCVECSRSFRTMKSLRMHRRLHSDRSFMCHLCGAGFVTQSSLNGHLERHSGDKQHVCKECGSAFPVAGALNNHMRRVHAEKGAERPWACDRCGRTFWVPSDLKKHMTIHGEVLPFKCGVCPKRFAHKFSMQQHEKLHSRARPFKCGVCEKTFSLKASMLQHQQLHTGDKPFECEICGMAFAIAPSRRAHMHRSHGISESPIDETDSSCRGLKK